METSKPTPGPWQLGLLDRRTPLSTNRVWPTAGFQPICILNSFGTQPPDLDPIAQANGALIAASPEMYTALCKIVDAYDNGKHEAVLAEIARAAIAKATGQS